MDSASDGARWYFLDFEVAAEWKHKEPVIGLEVVPQRTVPRSIKHLWQTEGRGEGGL